MFPQLLEESALPIQTSKFQTSQITVELRLWTPTSPPKRVVTQERHSLT